jgi:site-specific DNA-methyltransferase (adenine-specific)
MIKLYKGDCLIESDKIESGSVDLILTDLPYGNMKNAPSTWDKSKTEWDTVINPEKVYEIANRILRKNGKMILFSQEPYTTKLITEAIPNIPFSYRATWEKDNFANALCCNKNMVSFTEDVLLFSKTNPKSNQQQENPHPCKPYTNKLRCFINKKNYDIYDDFKNAGFKKYAVLDTFNSAKAMRYNFCTLETYNNLIELYNIDKMEGFINYDILLKKHNEWKERTQNELNTKYPSTFNLWEGKKYKSNILKYKKDYDGYHPTQKPVLLLEDLIKTFSNKNDLVVDLTMGSGSTMVACKNTNRNGIGIEMNDEYFSIAKKRVEKNILK